METLFCYMLPPLDYIDGLMTLEQFVKTMDEYMSDKVALLRAEARDRFKAMGWGGDLRHAELYFVVPADQDISIGMLLKDDNNGTTFIASQVPLPHLAQLHREYAFHAV